MAATAKSLFRATRPKPDRGAVLPFAADLPAQRREDAQRRDEDYYPTTDPDPIRALLSRDGDLIRAAGGTVWEPAVGAGDLAHEMRAFGLRVIGSDIADRGWPNTRLASFYDCDTLAPVIITNPPYCEINARDGHGRWLRHALGLPSWRYIAFLLSWEWPAARANGLGGLIDQQPFSWAYLMRWKIDFTGEGSPPQRNAWFVWSRDDPRGYGPGQTEPGFRFLDRTDDWRQEKML